MIKTFFHIKVIAILLLAPLAGLCAAEPQPGDSTLLWTHIRQLPDLGELRAMTAEWDAQAPGGMLKLTAVKVQNYAWAVIPAPKEGWNLGRRAFVHCEIANRGTTSLNVLLWVVGDRGWDAVPDTATLAPDETRRFSCRLRETFPDGTPKLDPGQVKQIQIMVSGRLTNPAMLELRSLVACGEAPEWKRPPGRLDVPVVETIAPVAGHRVRYRLAGDDHTDIYGVLQLPEDWKPGGKYPVIVEFPGNIFFTNGCYSTGRPDQCTMGFGMSQGKGAICLGLPFVNRAAGTIAEDGWGNPDDTADYAMKMVDDVCTKFGGDRANLVLTGFSRGAIACGYIGLRHDRLAALWKGFHACQHGDGDGWGGATMESAIGRARRFCGKGVFQTDNPEKTFQPVMTAMKTQVVWAQSGLGAHATAMFLDDRPSTQRLRQWFWNLVRQ